MFEKFESMSLLCQESWPKNLNANMGTLSTSWLNVWFQITNKVLCIQESMSSCVKSLRPKSRD